MDDSIVEAIAKSQQFSWLPSGRTTFAIMASAAHLKIPEPVNMVNRGSPKSYQNAVLWGFGPAPLRIY